MKVPVEDETYADIGMYFDDVVRFLQRVERCKGKVFVHCVAGASRAPSLVMAFLVRSKNITLWDAFAYVQARRPIAFPNSHFLFQLTQYEVCHAKYVYLYIMHLCFSFSFYCL
jgi:protein-tyrosine phosphatase